jgi:hypothetical protein
VNDDKAIEAPQTGIAVQTSQASGNAGGGLTRLVLLGLVIGAGVVIAKQFPDMKRYLKMRSM